VKNSAYERENAIDYTKKQNIFFGATCQKETVILIDNRFFSFRAKRLEIRAFRRFQTSKRQPFRVTIDTGVAAFFFCPQKVIVGL